MSNYRIVPVLGINRIHYRIEKVFKQSLFFIKLKPDWIWQGTVDTREEAKEYIIKNIKLDTAFEKEKITYYG